MDTCDGCRRQAELYHDEADGLAKCEDCLNSGSAGFSLDTPEQINAWVILSRISQAHLHMKGYTVKGLASWLKRNVPECENLRTVKQMYPRLLDYAGEFGIEAPGGEQCNYQVLRTPKAVLNGLYFDAGVVSSIEEVEANDLWAEDYADDRLVIIRTMDEPREADRAIQMVRAV